MGRRDDEATVVATVLARPLASTFMTQARWKADRAVERGPHRGASSRGGAPQRAVSAHIHGCLGVAVVLRALAGRGRRRPAWYRGSRRLSSRTRGGDTAMCGTDAIVHRLPHCLFLAVGFRADAHIRGIVGYRRRWPVRSLTILPVSSQTRDGSPRARLGNRRLTNRRRRAR